jgi:hypothetical protein
LTYSLPHSSRRDYCPRNKQEWIVAIKILYYRHGQLYAGFLQQHYPQLYHESVGCLVIGMQLRVQQD